jgi:hypothetical protein
VAHSLEDARVCSSSTEGVRFLLKRLSGDLSPLVMVGEIDWVAGRGLASRGTELQAVMLCGPVDVCGEDEDGRPLTAVKAGVKWSPSLSFSMNGAVLMTGKCSTADIVSGLRGLLGEDGPD